MGLLEEWRPLRRYDGYWKSAVSCWSGLKCWDCGGEQRSCYCCVRVWASQTEVTACRNVGTVWGLWSLLTFLQSHWMWCQLWILHLSFLQSVSPHLLYIDLTPECSCSVPRACSVSSFFCVGFTFRSLLAETIRWRPLLPVGNLALGRLLWSLCLDLTSFSVAVLPVKSYQQQGSVEIPLLSGLPLLPPSALCQDYADFHNLFFSFKEKIELHKACYFLQLILSLSRMVHSVFTMPCLTPIASSYSTRSTILYGLSASWSKKCIWPGWSSAKIAWLLYYF